MELHVVTITRASNGGLQLDNPHIGVRRGDILAFRAVGTDVLLCCSRARLFGAYRYTIAANTTLPLAVLSDAPQGSVSFWVQPDLTAECGMGSNVEGSITVNQSGSAPVRISQDAPLPRLNLRPNQTITFHAVDADVTLCFFNAAGDSSDAVFGQDRLVIPLGETRSLTVLSNAPVGDFRYRAAFNQIVTDCDIRDEEDDEEDGGGTVVGT